MKLNQINNLTFYSKIIDSHCHTGHWRNNNKIQDITLDLDVFVKSELDNGDSIENIIVSNLDCMLHKSTDKKIEFLSDEITGNKKILDICSKNSKFSPLATCQPKYGNVENIKKIFEENPLKFIGLKFHPEQLNVAANNPAYMPYMEFAQEKGLPCLFHSGNSYDVYYPDGGIAKASNVSKPEQIYELAKKYKDVPVIIAHWGGDGEKNFNKTTDLIIESIARKDATLYGDISWVDCNNPKKQNLKRIIERLKNEEFGLDRILFGTDAPLERFGREGKDGLSAMQNYTNNVNDIKNMIKKEFPNEAEDIIDKIFYKNAHELFFQRTTKQPPKKSDKKWGLIIAGVIVLATAIGAYFHNKSHKTAVAESTKTQQCLDTRACYCNQ